MIRPARRPTDAMPETTTRTFIAAELPEGQREALDRLREQLAPQVPGARWVSPSQYHVTLAFLGDVPNARIEGLCRAVEEAVAGSGPCDLRLEGLGAFPGPSRPRVLWAGLWGPGLDDLERLQAAVARAVSGAGPGDQADAHDHFSAHVTLARFKTGPGRPRPPDLTEILRRHADWSAGPFQIVEVVTFASELRPTGPVYTALARHPLAGV